MSHWETMIEFAQNMIKVEARYKRSATMYVGTFAGLSGTMAAGAAFSLNSGFQLIAAGYLLVALVAAHSAINALKWRRRIANSQREWIENLAFYEMAKENE